MYRRATQLSEATSSSTQHSRSSSRSNEATSDTSNLSSDGDDFVRDPTTIVGLACRVPGAQNPSKLWDNIVEQKDLQSRIPGDRFNVDAFYHPNGANKSTVRHPFYAL